MMTMDDLDEDDKARLQRYMEGEYTPSKKLVEIAEVDPFWETLGGNTEDPWGDGGETLRQREEAKRIKGEGLNNY